MANLSAVLGVVDSDGERVDIALRQNGGGFLPVYLQLDDTITATATRNGPVVMVGLSVNGGQFATIGYVDAAVAAVQAYGTQVGTAALGSDLSVAADGNFSDLLTVSIGSGFVGGTVKIEATAVASQSGADGTQAFRFLIDGLSGVAPSNQDVATGETQCMSLLAVVSLAAGAHTIKLQWKTSAGTIQCRPATANERAIVFAQLVGP